MATACSAKLKIRVSFDCDQDNINARRLKGFSFSPFNTYLLCFYSVPGPRLSTGSRDESGVFSVPGELTISWRIWQLCVVLESLFHLCGRKREVVKGASVSLVPVVCLARATHFAWV